MSCEELNQKGQRLARAERSTHRHSSLPENNAEFLEAVFHAAEASETGCIAATHLLRGRPTFPAYAWPASKVQGFHTHFGVGLHLPQDPTIADRTKFRRTKSTWRGMAVLVLDDVGQKKGDRTIKVPEMEPSFVVETKPGSQQWGYIFDEPVRDYQRAKLLLHSAIVAGVNDPGGQNPLRLVRLPDSLPHGKTHCAELVAWTGEHFSEAEVIKGLGLDLQAASKLVRAKASAPRTVGDPAPINSGHDPVLVWLDAQGMILGDLGDHGWIDIVCPWHDEHTDGETQGTGYRPPTNTDPYRSFNCFHRCSSPHYGRTTDAFLDWVRQAGGPDVGSLDEAVRAKRRAVYRKMRSDMSLGAADPVLLDHVRRAKIAAAGSDDWKRRINSISWLLCQDGWGDAEIIRTLISIGVMGPDIGASVIWVVSQIDSARKMQAANSRRDAERARRRIPNQAQRVESAIGTLSRLTLNEQKAIAKWLNGQIDG